MANGLGCHSPLSEQVMARIKAIILGEDSEARPAHYLSGEAAQALIDVVHVCLRFSWPLRPPANYGDPPVYHFAPDQRFRNKQDRRSLRPSTTTP